jgi:large subunit ribosomal protein L22
VLAAHRGRITKGHMPRAQGRSTPWNQETVNLEVVLEEVE